MRYQLFTPFRSGSDNRIVRLDGVVDDDEVAAATGEGAVDGHGEAIAAFRELDLCLCVLGADLSAGKDATIPVALDDGAEVIG